jgi:hypothetical protein
MEVGSQVSAFLTREVKIPTSRKGREKWGTLAKSKSPPSRTKRDKGGAPWCVAEGKER